MSLVVANCRMVVNAEPTATGGVDGTNANGSVSYNSSSATAVTTYSRTGATIEATATAYYLLGNVIYQYKGNTSTASMGGTSATATMPSNGDKVIGAKGFHHVRYGSGEWEATTDAGLTF